MITDVFYERYKANEAALGLNPARLSTPLNQGFQILEREGAEILRAIEESGFVQTRYRLDEVADSAVTRVCRELGWDRLNNEGRAIDQCKAVIALKPQMQIFEKQHGPFYLLALSVLEQMFAVFEKAVDLQIQRLQRFCEKTAADASKSREATARDGTTPAMAAQNKIARANALIDATRNAARASIDELNVRMSRAGIPLVYHSGMFQWASESRIEHEIAEPFWHIFADSKWASVVTDFQEAIDRRDNGGRDATKYAFMGLESVVRILSDDLSRTRGGETGFAQWLQNLVREVNGERLLDQWELEVLVRLNDAARNLHAHGPGAKPHPNKTPAQVNACIWTAMSWAQSLVTR